MSESPDILETHQRVIILTTADPTSLGVEGPLTYRGKAVNTWLPKATLDEELDRLASRKDVYKILPVDGRKDNLRIDTTE